MNRSLFLTLLTLVLLSTLSPAEDWSRWRGVRGDGTWQGPKLPPQWPQDGPRKKWSKPIGGGYAGIAVADGRLFTMDRQKGKLPGDPEAHTNLGNVLRSRGLVR